MYNLRLFSPGYGIIGVIDRESNKGNEKIKIIFCAFQLLIFIYPSFSQGLPDKDKVQIRFKIFYEYSGKVNLVPSFKEYIDLPGQSEWDFLFRSISAGYDKSETRDINLEKDRTVIYKIIDKENEIAFDGISSETVELPKSRYRLAYYFSNNTGRDFFYDKEINVQTDMEIHIFFNPVKNIFRIMVFPEG